MIVRIIACVWFLLGGIATVFILIALGAFGSSMAAMSASATTSQTSSELMLLVAALASVYFLVSAVASLVANSRETLITWAWVAHLALLAPIPLVVFGAKSGGALAGLAVLFVLSAVYLSPWIAMWMILLMKPDKSG